MDGYAVSKYYSKRNNIKRFFNDLEQLVEVIRKDLQNISLSMVQILLCQIESIRVFAFL